MYIILLVLIYYFKKKNNFKNINFLFARQIFFFSKINLKMDK